MLGAIIVGISTIPIIYEDFRYRGIQPWILIVFVVACLISGLTHDLSWIDFLFNTAFILLQWLGLFLYFSIKNRKFINIVDTRLGSGDLVFFLGLCFLMPKFVFLHYFIFATVSTLLASIFMSPSGKHGKAIPLAGWMGIFLFLFFAVAKCLGIDVLSPSGDLAFIRIWYGLK